ncbi:hypothetical protein GCM10023223_22270 [Stackebrandtia albiflava]
MAGWIAVAFGIVHTAVAPWDTRDTWTQVFAEGWWNTFTLDQATTLAALDRSETFWMTIGSFGVPVLILGCHVLWSVRRRHRVPAGLGWLLLVWASVLATAAPVSPAWALVVVGALIVVGDRAGRPVPGHPNEPEPDGGERSVLRDTTVSG